MSALFEARRIARDQAAQCDDTIANWDGVARAQRGDAVPPIEATDDQRALTETAEFTVSVAWLAYMLDFLAQYDGPRGGAS